MTKIQKIQNVLNFGNSNFEFVLRQAQDGERSRTISNFDIRASSFVPLWFVATFLFLLNSSPAFAASISISDAGPQILTSGDQEYHANISLSINASDGTKYYMGGVFSVQGTTNYCGKTWNAEKSSWVSYTDEANLPVITIASSSAVIPIKARLDTEDNGCQSPGTYTFKVRRYTQGGSASFDEQNEQTVVIAIPTATPSPTRTPSPTTAPKPDPTATRAPSEKPVSSPTATQKAKTPSKTAPSTQLSQGGIVTTDRNEATVSASPTGAEHGTQSANVLGITDSSSRVNPFIVGLIAAGGACVGSAGYLMIRARRTQ